MREEFLELPRAPRVLYLIGLAGVGKSYVGDLLGRRAGFHVYHADDDLPAEMRRKVARREPWTEDERERYFTLVRDRIRALRARHARVVVTQATYRQDNRDLMRGAVDDPAELEFLWIVADREINRRRVRERNDYVTVEYFELSAPYFETPPAGTKKIVNDAGEEEIVRQLRAFYG